MLNRIYSLAENCTTTAVYKSPFVNIAEYHTFDKGKKVKYVTRFVSIIDVPYKRYRLI